MARDKTYIYSIRHSQSGKMYIGKTHDVENRWRQHRKCNDGFVLHHALRKYGLLSFEFDILASCNEDEGGDWETYYIQFYNSMVPNGYNLKSGGDGGRHHAISRAKMSASHKGKIVSDVTRSRMSASRSGALNPNFGKASNAKPVGQYTKTGLLVKVFPDGLRAARSLFPDEDDLKRLRSRASCVNSAAAGKISEAYGFVWRRGDASEFPTTTVIQTLVRGNCRAVMGIKDGEVQEYDSILQAANAVGCARENISACLNNTNNTCRGFVWRYI